MPRINDLAKPATPAEVKAYETGLIAGHAAGYAEAWDQAWDDATHSAFDKAIRIADKTDLTGRTGGALRNALALWQEFRP